MSIFIIIFGLLFITYILIFFSDTKPSVIIFLISTGLIISYVYPTFFEKHVNDIKLSAGYISAIHFIIKGLLIIIVNYIFRFIFYFFKGRISKLEKD